MNSLIVNRELFSMASTGFLLQSADNIWIIGNSMDRLDRRH